MAERPAAQPGGLPGDAMPEFEMPPEPIGPPPTPESRGADVGAAPPQAALDRGGARRGPSPEVSDARGQTRDHDAPPSGRAGRRYSLRALAGVGILGVVLGAILPGGIQLAERAAANADRTSLEQAALAYLTALSEGRAADAGALVEPPAAAGALLVDAVLASADRLVEPTVSMVVVDGEDGRVDVGYRVDRIDVQRTLEAEREGASWRITTPLIEVVSSWDSGQVAEIGGVALPAGSFSLYPGVYEVAGSDGPIVSVQPVDVRVDGDPATPTDLYLEPVIAAEVEAEARELAAASVTACLASGDCPAVPGIPGAEPRIEHVYLQSVSSGPDGPVHDIGVSISLVDPADPVASTWVDVTLRVAADEDGGGRRWSCMTPGAMLAPGGEGELVACSP